MTALPTPPAPFRRFREVASLRRFREVASLRRFRDDAEASVSVEAVLVVPFLVWAYLGVFSVADAFRTVHSNINASYSLGDALSRETDYVDAAYLDGLNDLHKILTRSQGATDVRVTVVRYDEDSDLPELVWSNATGDKGSLIQADLTGIADQLPQLAPGESIIVVETWTEFTPVIRYMVSDMEFYSLVVTRPRFAPQLVWGS